MLTELISAVFGSSGQRCMALKTTILVGETSEWIPEIIEKSKKLKLGAGHEAGVDISPLCYPELRDRVKHLITSAEKEGA